MIVRDLPLSAYASRWPDIRLDQFEHLEEMRIEVMDMLQKFLHYAFHTEGYSHHINSDYRPTDKKQHGKGLAVDLYLYKKKPGDTPCLVQQQVALRFNFTGVGFYPYWNTPGIHVDCREGVEYRKLWWFDANGIQHTVDSIPKEALA